MTTFATSKTPIMTCNDFNADILPVEEPVAQDLLQKIKAIKNCGHCIHCLYTYIMLAPTLCDEELTSIFGSDLLNANELKDELSELAGFKLNPYPNRLRIARVNKSMQKISLQKERGDKTLVKHYINECIRQLEGDMLEEYYNMAP